MSIYGQRSNNGSVECFGVPIPFLNDGPSWTANLLFLSPNWGDGGTVVDWAWGIQPGNRYSRFYVLWRGAVPDREAYLPEIPDNACATVHRICDARLQEHCMVQYLNLFNLCHIFGDDLVNRTNGTLDDIGDELAQKYILLKISVVSVSSYLWIAAWIACWIASGINRFLGIFYGINLFFGIFLCRIADC